MRNSVLKGLLASAIAAALLSACGGDEKPAEQPPAETVASTDAPATEAPPVDEPPAEEGRTRDLRKRLMDSTTQQEEWVPELVATPGESTADMLRRAGDAERAGRLDQGDNNALSLYMSVLEREPDNAEAKAGVDKVVASLVARGEQVLEQARFNEAARLAQVVAKLRPDDAAVQAFKAKVDAGREIGLLIGEAQRMAAAGKAVEPAGDNALAIYKEILRTNPGNQAAEQGIVALEKDLIDQAIKAAESGDYDRAQARLADAGKVRPGSSAVQNASARVLELRGEVTAPLVAQANAAIDAKDFDQAAQIIGQIEAVSAQARGLEDLRQKLESARDALTLKPGQGFSDALRAGGQGPEMVVMPAGSFLQGSPDGERDRKNNEGPQHTVTFRKPFALARTELTVDQFKAFVNATGYRPTSSTGGSSTVYDERTGAMVDRKGVDWRMDHSGNIAGGNLPVVHVSWTDAKAYVDWLAKETGKPYRLPSESEYEYAQRAGSTTLYPWGNDEPNRVVGNLTGKGDRSATGRKWVNAFDDYDDGYWGAAPVRTFETNRFGLFDMVGNVSEWVEDCWHENYQRAPTDGSAWVNEGCNRRVIRGASWASAPDQVRSAFRLTAGAGTTNARLGFRIARDL